MNDTKKLPVLIFIFGGGFTKGTADDTTHGPDFLLEREIIYVTISYRLGVLGFMSLGTPEFSGNMGLKDQQLALKWIYENIESFGGDNTRITLSGHSAGKRCLLSTSIPNRLNSLYECIIFYFCDRINVSWSSFPSSGNAKLFPTNTLHEWNINHCN